MFLAVVTLPISPSESPKPTGGESPTAQILLLLTLSIGLPYLVLSATGPLIQAWFAKAHPGRSPYRLYALSNVGSLLALLGFPFLVEPWTARSQQVNWWSLGMVLYSLVCGCLVWLLRAVPEPEPEKSWRKPKKQTADCARWQSGFSGWPCRPVARRCYGHHQQDLSGCCRSTVSLGAAIGAVLGDFHHQF